MKMLIGDQVHSIPLLLPPDADRFAGSQATAPISMARATVVQFEIKHGVGATGTYTVKVEACDDTVPTNQTAIAFCYRTLTESGGLDTWSDWATATTSGVTITAGSNQAMQVEVTENELTNGYGYVRLTTTEVVNDPVDGSVSALVLHDVKGETVPTVLA